MPRTITTFATLALCALAACATGAASLPTLEQQARANPTSAASNRALGIAYYRAKRYGEARAALETASRLDPNDGVSALYLGLSAEELGDLAAAKRAYSSYLEHGRTRSVRNQLQQKLAALTRRELLAEAKLAVAQERTIGAEAPSPRTVAVMPLRFSGPDTSLKPLERGFADLLTTDLARSAQLTLVERSRMQALLDEMQLQAGGATDAASNVRAGRLVRAGRVVQGSLLQLGASQLRVDAAVVDVPTTQIKGATQGDDALEQVFALEKKIALGLFSELGVTLTPAERQQIEQRPTRSLAAFLAYSRGLTLEDQGRYDEASRFYDQAVRIDPGFGSAQLKSRETRAAAQGAQVTAATVESSIKGTSEGAAAGTGLVSTTVTSTAQTAASDLNPSTTGAATGAGTATGAPAPPAKDPVSAGTNTDAPAGGSAKVTIVISRPKTP